MYDCGGPLLVFVTQTHHPILEYHTGYIFAYYEMQFHKPKEMFFVHVHEAQVFALYRRAQLQMDPDQKPETVTALEYTLAGQDESLFMHVPDLRTTGSAKPGNTLWKGKPAPPELTEVPEPEDIPTIDWFGEE